MKFFKILLSSFLTELMFGVTANLCKERPALEYISFGSFSPEAEKCSWEVLEHSICKTPLGRYAIRGRHPPESIKEVNACICANDENHIHKVVQCIARRDPENLKTSFYLTEANCRSFGAGDLEIKTVEEWEAMAWR